MSSIGSVSKIIPAQNVQLSRDSSGDPVSFEELILTSDVKFRGTHIRNTKITRAGPIYTFQWRDREIEATVALTEDLLTQLETDNTLNSRSALPFNNWKINGLNISNTVGDDTDDTYSAALVDYEELAGETDVAEVRIKLLIAGTAS